METVYFGCATLGGTLLACQFLMTLFGLGGHYDLGGDHEIGHEVGHHDGDHDQSWFVGVLTFRTIVAALTFFGLGGMTATTRGFEPMLTLVLAAAAGSGAMFMIAWMMKGLYKLKAEGTVRIERSVGTSGTVYLTIPANKGGVGKVTLTVQNRTVEYQAVTSEPNDLPTGTKVVTVAVIGPGTVEVALVPTAERVTHD